MKNFKFLIVSVIVLFSATSLQAQTQQDVLFVNKSRIIYKGIKNPITISIPDVPKENVKVTCNGLRTNEEGQYYIVPPFDNNKMEIKIEGTKTNGEKVSFTETLLVKDIPKPVTTIKGEYGKINLKKCDLKEMIVEAELPEFSYFIEFQVETFTLKATDMPPLTIKGNAMTEQAKEYISKIKSGSELVVFNTKAKVLKAKSNTERMVLPLVIKVL